jgi:sporulation protein YlmC with PRC-barrel domain
VYYLSELLGSPVYDAAGKRIGRIGDVSVRTNTLPPRVASLSIQDRRVKENHTIAWEDITTLESGRVKLRVTEDLIGTAQQDETLLRLGYDLLDQQIIDVNGR